MNRSNRKRNQTGHDPQIQVAIRLQGSRAGLPHKSSSDFFFTFGTLFNTATILRHVNDLKKRSIFFHY